MGPLRPTSSALTICWAQTSAGSGPEVTLNGSLPAHFWAGPTSVHLWFTSAHFCRSVCHTPRAPSVVLLPKGRGGWSLTVPRWAREGTGPNTARGFREGLRPRTVGIRIPTAGTVPVPVPVPVPGTGTGSGSGTGGSGCPHPPTPTSRCPVASRGVERTRAASAAAVAHTVGRRRRRLRRTTNAAHPPHEWILRL